MSTATMHFGPEWMRTKNQPLARSQLEPSAPPANALPQTPSTLATYSALVSAPPVASEKLDESHPFRYSKEELLAVYQEGGGRGRLGLEVDRWEGVVREVAMEPVTLREMTDTEKKLFAGSLNSEMRRRPSQSTDYFSPLNTTGLERPRIMTGGTSPLRERYGAMKRKDSAGTADSSSASMPRKPSLSTLQVPGMLSPTSPRTRLGHTSNFDGVLKNGESWMARRRFSEASMKASTSSSTDAQAEDTASKLRGAAKVKEKDSATTGQVCKEEQATSPGINSAISTSHSVKNAVDVAENLTGTGSLSTTYYQEMGQSPVVLDLAAVEWVYKDPTGQVQGPFRADLMQKWYEEGYFTPDLPMKRTHLDSQWYTVQELVTQATSPSVFLTPPLPARPPGLNQNQQSSLRTPEHSHNEPFQPAPIRSLRTSTLESSLTGVPLTSDSPPSSFGASQLSSPEPSTFIGRDKRPYGSTEADGRILAFGLQDLSTSGFMGTQLNSNDFDGLNPTFEGQSPASFVPDVDGGLNGLVFNQHPAMVQDSWTGFQNSSFGISNANLASSRGVPPTNFFNNGVARSYGFELGGSNHLAHFGVPQPGNIVSNPVNHSPIHERPGTVPFTGLVQQPYAAQFSDFGHNQPPSQTSSFRIQESISPLGPPIHNDLSPGHSPWSIMPGPRIHVPVSVDDRLEPTALHANDGLNGVTAGSAEPTTSVLGVEVEGRHNAPQELAQLLNEKLSVFEQDTRNASASYITAKAPPASETGKSSTKASKSVSKVPLDQVPLSDGLASQMPSKAAWTKDDDGKGKKGTSASISLRAIQEAEAKRQQNLKAIEREKEKSRANILSEAKEDLQPFTTSWGLPTSQAGARSNIITPAKDVPAPPIATTQTSPVAPVWTTTAKAPVVKKSMKEIQEEEEKRKRQAARDNSAPTTSKRPFPETSKTTSSSIPAASSNINPWTTVGSNGKPAFAAQPNTTPFSLAVSGPSAISRSTAPPKITTTSPTKMRPVSKPAEVHDTPSYEFLKWLGDSLKGLNSSANVEEIMSMLLSFPLDPDSSTLEIISDMIYANSTTLDGRRFAAEFVAKRKADRSKGPVDSGKAPASKPATIADVVKAVPKSTQTEWGFKVVNKKKKGGRS